MCMSKRRGPDSIMPRFRWMSNSPFSIYERGVFIRMACPLRFLLKESWPPVLFFAFLSLGIGRTN